MITYGLVEAAAKLHMHPSTLLERARAGEVRAAKLGRAWVFLEDDLMAYLKAHYHQPPCQSTKGVKSGTRISPSRDSDIGSLLGLPTGKRRFDSTMS